MKSILSKISLKKQSEVKSEVGVSEPPVVDTFATAKPTILADISNIETLLLNADRYRTENRYLRIMILSLIVITLLAIFGAYKISMLHIQKPVNETFFAITDDGRLTSITAEEDKYSQSMILQFVQEAVIESFSFDFVQENNKEHLNKVVRKYYSQSGFESFIEALNKGQFLDRLYANREISRATVIGQPILRETVRGQDGRDYYVIDTRLHINFIGARGGPNKEEKLLVTVALTRLPVFEAVRGIGITQLQAKFE